MTNFGLPMHRDSFDPAIETGIFSELFGFVVTDPVSLESFHKKSLIGIDLLKLYTRTDEGDKVAKAGAAIPIILDSAVERARAGCDAVRWQGATTRRA